MNIGPDGIDSDMIGLLAGIAVALAVFAIGMAVRLPRFRRLIAGVDWARVSDPDGLAQWTSLLTTLLAGLIVVHVTLLYAWHGLPELQHTARYALLAPMAAVGCAIAIVKRRFHDRPARNGQR